MLDETDNGWFNVKNLVMSDAVENLSEKVQSWKMDVKNSKSETGYKKVVAKTNATHN